MPTDNDPVPEADEADLDEGQREVAGAGGETRPADDPEAPEADALEQAQGVGSTAPAPADRTSDPETPEADALEQRQQVAGDDADEWR